MEEEDDPYASILEMCKPTIPTRPSSLETTTTTTTPLMIDTGSSSNATIITPLYMRFIDHSLDADGTIIPPDSIGAYLLCQNDDDDDDQSITNNNTNNDDTCIIEGQGQHHNQNDYLYIHDHHRDTTPTPPCHCVVSYQILSPPSSMDLDLDLDLDLELESSPPYTLVHDHDLIDSCDHSSGDTQHHHHHSLWLSQLKSMATTPQDDAFHHASSLVTQFRSSKCWLSLSPSSDSTLCLSQLNSMATQEGLFFHHAVSFVTQFRASKYRLSLSPSHSAMKRLCSLPNSRKGEHPLNMQKRDFANPIKVVPPKSSSHNRGLGYLSKSQRKNVSVDPPLKKQKLCNTNLDIESSTCSIGTGSNELERGTVFVSEQRQSRFIGLGGGLRADIDRTSSAKSTGNLDKSKGLSSAVDANSNVGGQHNLAASSRKATMSAAKSVDVGSSKSRFENPMLKHFYGTVNMAV